MIMRGNKNFNPSEELQVLSQDLLKTFIQEGETQILENGVKFYTNAGKVRHDRILLTKPMEIVE